MTQRQFLNMSGVCASFMYGLSLCLFLIDYLNYNSLVNRYQISICIVADTIIKVLSPNNMIAEVLFQNGNIFNWIEVGTYQNLTAAQDFLHECYPRNGTNACYVSSSDIRLYLSESYGLITACLVFFILGTICILIYIGLKIFIVCRRRGYSNIEFSPASQLDFNFDESSKPPPVDFAAVMRSFDQAQYYMWRYKQLIQRADFDDLRDKQMTAIMGTDTDKASFQSRVKIILERVGESSG